MAITDQNFEIWGGETPTLDITALQSDGSKLDLTNAESVEWRLNLGDNTVITKTLDDGIELGQPVNNIINTLAVTLATEDTEDVVGNGIYEHQLRAVTATGIVTTTTVGWVTINQSLI